MGTEEQGWVAHFVRSAWRDEEITLFGDGRQVRDVMHVRDVAAAYISAMRAMPRVAGEAFNLGGGSANAVSLIQILHEIELLTGRAVRLRHGERSEEHTSELQSLMRISYAVFCLKKKKTQTISTRSRYINC